MTYCFVPWLISLQTCPRQTNGIADPIFVLLEVTGLIEADRLLLGQFIDEIEIGLPIAFHEEHQRHIAGDEGFYHLPEDGEVEGLKFLGF